MLVRRIALGIALSASAVSLGQAQVVLDVSKVTCEQFYFAKVGHPLTLSIWLSGYYHGKRDNSRVEVQKVKENAEKVQRFCRQHANYNVSIMEAAERVLGKPQ